MACTNIQVFSSTLIWSTAQNRGMIPPTFRINLLYKWRQSRQFLTDMLTGKVGLDCPSLTRSFLVVSANKLTITETYTKKVIKTGPWGSPLYTVFLSEVNSYKTFVRTQIEPDSEWNAWIVSNWIKYLKSFIQELSLVQLYLGIHKWANECFDSNYFWKTTTIDFLLSKKQGAHFIIPHCNYIFPT